MPTPELGSALEWARRGDPRGFRDIYRALAPTVTRVLYALNPYDAEDIASETWLAVARDLGGFRGEASGLKPWIMAIARNRHRDWCRRAAHRPRIAPIGAVGDDPPSPFEDDPAVIVALASSTAAAVALVRRLPESQAEVVILRVVAGLDVDEVAQVTGRRPGTVRVLAHRGLRTLARNFEPDHPAPVGISPERVTPTADWTL